MLLLGASRAKTLDVALMLWGSAVRTWPRLYRIYEEIQNFGGNRFFGAGNDKDRFTHSANHPDTAGLDSRHGISNQQPPKRPMTLEDATRFIGQALSEALREAASTVGDASE